MSSLSNLESLDIAGCPVTDNAVAELIKLNSLQTLQLWGCRITDEGVFYLSSLPKLKILGLYECDELTDISLSFFAHFPALRSLELGSSGLTDAGTCSSSFWLC